MGGVPKSAIGPKSVAKVARCFFSLSFKNQSMDTKAAPKRPHLGQLGPDLGPLGPYLGHLGPCRGHLGPHFGHL